MAAAHPHLYTRVPRCSFSRLSRPFLLPMRPSSRDISLTCPAASRAGMASEPLVQHAPARRTSDRHDPFLSTFDHSLRQGDLQQCVALLRQRTEGAASRASNRTSASSAPGREQPQQPQPLQLGSERLTSFADACFAARSPGLALEAVQLLPPDPRHYNTLLRCCGKHRDLSLVPAIEATRRAAGLGPDSYSQVALISAYASCQQLKEALEVFYQSWQLEPCRTLGVCNSAISACAAQGDWGLAQQALEMLRQAGIPPDIITFNSLIKAAGAAGAMGEARALYGALQEEGLAPTAVTYTALFNAAAKCRQADIGWLLQVYEDMAWHGVQPNDYVLSALFTAASYCPCSPANLEALFRALALYRARVKPNDTVFTALLMMCTRLGIADRAVDVWTAVQEDGVPFSAHLFSALFKACAAGTSPTLVDVAMQAYHDMHMWWTAHKQGPGSAKFQRDMLVAYNALLHFIGEMAQLDEALAVFRAMQRTGPKPDVVTFNTMIAACSHRGDTSHALKIFSTMMVAGVAPTERTIGALLNTYAKARNVPSARMIFDSLEGGGLRPNVHIYTSFMDACVKDGSLPSLDMAFSLLDRMRSEGLQPTAVTYGCLLVACERRRDVDRAFQLYQDACDEGVLPTDECHNVLINVCTEAQRLDEALELVKRLARKHGTMQQHTMNSLTRALCPKYIDRALRMMSLTRTLGLKPTRWTYIALIEGCAQASYSDTAYQLYQSLRSQGLQADGSSGSALIISLCQASQLELAVKVYEDMQACAWRKELQLKDIPTDVAHKGGLSRRAQVPDAAALAALAQAYAGRGQTRLAFKYYKQLRRDGKGLAWVTMSNRRMFELLLENLLRQRNVRQALQVFDDWKGASAAWLASKAGKAEQLPKLSNVTLAFLESTCRREPEYEWRVYDVCAVMRQQKERKAEAKLARPPKRSHHFLESTDL